MAEIMSSSASRIRAQIIAIGSWHMVMLDRICCSPETVFPGFIAGVSPGNILKVSGGPMVTG